MLTQDLPVIAPDEAHERLVSPAPVLISEADVALATAITLATAMVLRNRPPARRRWMEATRGLLATARRSLTAPAYDATAVSFTATPLSLNKDCSSPA